MAALRGNEKKSVISSLFCCQNLFHFITSMLVFGVCVCLTAAERQHLLILHSTFPLESYIFGSNLIYYCCSHHFISSPVLIHYLLFDSVIQENEEYNSVFFFLFIALNSFSIFKNDDFYFGKMKVSYLCAEPSLAHLKTLDFSIYAVTPF